MNEDLKLIKKKYGEGMAHFCREYFHTLLEKKGLLPDLLLKKFEPNKFLYNDILESNLENAFVNFIYSLVNVESQKEEKSNKSPQELMIEAGYDLYECHTEEDIQSFKKYYHEEEELCTFNGGRLNSCHVFFAVKHDVDNIKREDFQEPKREDLYGTSVISIQFTRDEAHILSIKNRYNHTVLNPDATFSNNLDNIILGLTKSFEDYYGMKQKFKSDRFELPNYFWALDGKYYKYNYIVGNYYFCPNNKIIDANGIHKFESDKYIILDYFILDLVNKKIYLYDNIYIYDSFIDTIGEIKRINCYTTNFGKEIVIVNKNNEVSIIEINKENKIIGYTNFNVKTINNNFLYNNRSLRRLSLPSVEKIGICFLGENKILTEIDLPNVKEIGDLFLDSNMELTEISLPNVVKIGECFLTNNEILIEISLPNVREIGDRFLFRNKFLEKIDLPSVAKIGDYFLFDNEEISLINAPNLLEANTSHNNQLLVEIVKKKKRFRERRR